MNNALIQHIKKNRIGINLSKKYNEIRQISLPTTNISWNSWIEIQFHGTLSTNSEEKIHQVV
jgi:hypothetical protein